MIRQIHSQGDWSAGVKPCVDLYHWCSILKMWNHFGAITFTTPEQEADYLKHNDAIKA